MLLERSWTWCGSGYYLTCLRRRKSSDEGSLGLGSHCQVALRCPCDPTYRWVADIAALHGWYLGDVEVGPRRDGLQCVTAGER